VRKIKYFSPFIFIACFIVSINSYAAVLWSQDFTSGATGFYTTSGMTRNAGNLYSCVFADYVYYTSSTNAYVMTNTINVPQGRGITFTFDSKRNNTTAGTIQIYYLITGACSWDHVNPKNNGWVLWGTITPNASALQPGGCTTQSLSLESFVCGGQNIAILMYFPNASSTNRISIDNMRVEDTGPTSSPVPNITGATTYTENFTTNRWYGPVNSGDHTTTGVRVPYRSYRSASSAYAYLWNNGAAGTGNHTGVWSDYYVAFYTGFEFCNSSGSSQIITKELNTASCAAAQLKYAWKAKYPCTAGDFSYTWDESYHLNSPYVHVSTGQGYTWVELPVNEYFPDGLWHYAAYQLPSASNIKIKFSRGGSCSNPAEGIDEIKVLCRNCAISTLSGGTITGPAEQIPNTDYDFTITPTPGATYYKWMIRAIDDSPPLVYSNPCPDGGNPCIVSGQGTTTVTVNFGSTPANYRVMCIPFDANPGTLTLPSDACYAKISIHNVALPVELTYFIMEDLNGTPLLKWQTASETNNDRFEIHKSNDGIDFSYLGTVKGAGNSNNPIEYQFHHTSPPAGITYYKLLQFDYNGNQEALGVLSFINEHPLAEVSIYVSDNQLYINFGQFADGRYLAEIFDLNGKIIYSFSIEDAYAFSGSTYYPENISKGIYAVKLSHSSGDYIISKIVF
jgi:hypothetical protein